MNNSTAATKVASKGSTSSRQSKNGQDVNRNSTATVDPPASQEELNQKTDKSAQVIAMPQLKLQETPEQATKTSAQIPLPGNRPIDSANLQVLGTISEMGDRRPIVASNILVRETMSVSGERPIAASSIQISEIQMIMGNRPIASNYIDGDKDLMGYLD